MTTLSRRLGYSKQSIALLPPRDLSQKPPFSSTELTENERMDELLAQLARGNHSSAISDMKGLNGMTGKDVTKGFSLPDKFTAWTSDIIDILGRSYRVVTRKELESLIGRLNHASFMIPLSRHSLSNLRSKLKSKPRPKSRSKSETWFRPKLQAQTKSRLKS